MSDGEDLSDSARLEALVRALEAAGPGAVALALELQEEERHRIARELHDALGQMLASLSMLVRSVEGLAANTELTVKLVEIRDLIEASTAEVSRLSEGLAPVGLEQEDLLAALIELSATHARIHRTEVEVSAGVGVEGRPVKRHIRTAVYRIAQEALMNATKHAQCKRIRVELSIDGDQLIVQIADDGRGLAQVDTSRRQGLGLSSIGERARLLGGRATLSTLGTGGMVVSATIPLGSHEP